MRNHFTATAVARETTPRDRHCTEPKVLLYSHDTFGLGSIRHTLLLAESLAAPTPRRRC
jgi:predicted glycosyltransferase